ncbi:uncharacterized protein SPPG_06905 [Spizellomyces punctatus DAOM BR117]|uniref:RNI-like protein n=1 Tax=Spizellomyces punctatus (strain DAOM BR117) TaxID=645134 RepID=A0A0L0H8Q6_SPIPD|nr:uncharacterized protein SPPG_06905 [Spizellomyces punctatus DAOM BR117]KNC97915.1 hypothetical protein SPPG_06905 [Spizellomyces punctatus DAOM BR117]|eukprot:XP_016605955.1 hypothetical protein SPPG_06905 [Spizellomyces punctatus DAOM BR117]
MLSEGFQIARYYAANRSLLDESSLNDRTQRIQNSRNERSGTPLRTMAPGESPTRRSLIAPRLLRRDGKSERPHWSAGATIQVGLCLGTVADKASIVNYPNLPGPKTCGSNVVNGTNKSKRDMSPIYMLQECKWTATSSDSSSGSGRVVQLPATPQRITPKEDPRDTILEVSHGGDLSEISESCDFRLHLIEACHKCFSDRDKWVRLAGDAPELYPPSGWDSSRKECIIYALPAAVAYMSGTIKHIDCSAKSFKEHLEGVIRFPTTTTAVMAEVVAYMYWLWCKSHQPSLFADLTARYTRKFATLAVRPAAYRPQTLLLFEIMEASVYLDLPGLVDMCAVNAATHFDSITSFGGLPKPLIRNVLKRLSIGDLCISEYELVDPCEHPLRGAECNSNGRISLDTTSIWIRNFLKIQATRPCDEQDSYTKLLNWSEAGHLRESLRQICVKFYIDECLRRELPPSAESKLLQVMQMEATHLNQISLTVNSSTGNRSLSLWATAVQKLPDLKAIHVTVEDPAPAILEPLLQALVVPGRALRLEFPCSDAVKIQDVARLVTVPGITSSSQETVHKNGVRTPALRASAGWQPVFPLPGAFLDSKVSHRVNIGNDEGAKMAIVSSPRGSPWRQIGPALLQSSRMLPLTDLDLSKQPLGLNEAEMLGHTLETCTTLLHRLRLAHCSLGSAGIIRLARALSSNRTLQYLDISWNIASEDKHAYEAARALGQSLELPSCALTEIVLSGNHFTTLGVVALIDVLKGNRRILDFNFSQIDLNASLVYLAKALLLGTNRTVNRVDVSSSKLLPRRIAEFCEILTDGLKNATLMVMELNMSGILFNESIAHSLGSLFQCPSFQCSQLILEGADTGHVLRDRGCLALLKTLRRNTSLRHLNLSRQALGDDSCKGFAQLLIDTHITELTLRDNFIGDGGVHDLQKGLSKVRERGDRRPVRINLDQNIISRELTGQLEEILPKRLPHVIFALNQRDINR